jgi:hypothetical protein
VCSTKAAQLARICRAIEDLAGHTGDRRGTAADPAGREGDAEAAPEEALAARLAEIWAMIAQADPELAKRVPGYLTAAD